MDIRSIDRNQMAQALGFRRLIDQFETALLEPMVAPLRQSLAGPRSGELLVMPALSDRFGGVKILSVVEENADRGLPVIGGLFVLIDAGNGTPLATMDVGELTARRTAAVSALAARRLARADARRLLVLGTGHLAPYLAEAHAAVRPIESIGVWGRSPDKAAASCAEIRRRLPGVDVAVIDDLVRAVRDSDIISAATRATEPVIRGAWLSKGAHVDLVGGYRPDMREIDDDGILRASLYVDTMEGVCAEAGDLLSPIKRGVISEDAILGDLTALLAGQGRRDAEEITLFKSVGTARADLAAAALAWDGLHG